MDKCLTGLKPQIVWKFFDEIRKIPRGSGNEQGMIEYLIRFATKNHLSYKKDKIGNILISKKASVGKEKAKKVILQSHIDMVCEKNADVKFDFLKDAINIQKKAGWISAKGTTLGADDGIGVAMSLAILYDKKLFHGPMEGLFTVSEETNLSGAREICPSFIDADYLINIDIANDKEICIGCAGGEEFIFNFKIRTETSKLKNDAYYSLCVSVKGLLGGHSGEDINKNRSNAIKLLTETLVVLQNKYDYELENINGGDKRNAIPREASCKILVIKKEAENIISEIKNIEKKIKKEIKKYEPKFEILISRQNEQKNTEEVVLSEQSKKQILRFLLLYPNGIMELDKKLNCVKTSINLGAINLTLVKNKTQIIQIGTLLRSTNQKSLDTLARKITSLVKKFNIKIEHFTSFPPWSAKTHSRLSEIMKKEYVAKFKSAPKVITIHAGLEPALFTLKNRKLDMVSIGPNTENLHSPSERVSIKSTQKTYNLLLETLKEI